MCEECVNDTDGLRTVIGEMMEEGLSEERIEINDAEKPTKVVEFLGSVMEAHEENSTEADRAAYAEIQQMAQDFEDRAERGENPPEEDLQELRRKVAELLESLEGTFETSTYSSADRYTKDDIATDQAAFPEESTVDSLIRGIQHVAYYHRITPSIVSTTLSAELAQAVVSHVSEYAQNSLRQAVEHGVLHPIDADGITKVVVGVATACFFEGTISGYYSGSQGQECLLMPTHDLDPEVYGPSGSGVMHPDDAAAAHLKRIQEYKERENGD